MTLRDTMPSTRGYFVGLVCAVLFIIVVCTVIVFSSGGELAVARTVITFDVARTVPPETKPPSDSHKLNETRVYKWKGGKWVQLPGFCTNAQNLNSATLKTPVGSMKMYIHDIPKDIWVSGNIKQHGIWDGRGVNAMVSRLKADTDLGVLDLGCQLGQFALVAAMMGRHVVAVDPLVENVIRLCKSVQDANMADRVTILFTALSDTYGTMSFFTPGNNIGGTHIESAGKNIQAPKNDYDSKYISSVLLDDILPFIDFKKAFIKIDVENHEYHAMRKGDKLFAAIDIRGILMEWFQVKNTTDGLNLKAYLNSKNYYATSAEGFALSQTDYKSWPVDVVWLKR